MRFLPHAHRISLLSPAPVSHIFHSCRPSMPRKQKAALVPTPIKQSHEAMVVSYRPQTLHDTIHTVLPGEVLPAIPGHSEFIAVRLFVFQLTASRKDWRPVLLHSSCRVSYFNSQPHEEADIGYLTYWIFPPLFQLTASRRGWRNLKTLSMCQEHFNSQPHEEADPYKAYLEKFEAISTHSLTKRLTRWFYWKFQMENYFNSQPHEEADDKFGVIPQGCTLFQLTASRRGWQPATRSPFRSSIFQLTASRRGWLCRILLLIRYRHFNSQPHEEADDETTSSARDNTIFQLTASRRGWLWHLAGCF